MHKRPEDSDDQKALPKARIAKSRTSWLLWLLPAGAALLCVWFVYRDFVATGPKITILFSNAEGLEESNTKLQYRGAAVGVVKKLALTKDKRYVATSVRLTASAKNLARSGSIFWIVRPEVKLGGISGLRTIVSGEYIDVQPGDGPFTNHFVGADQAPVPQEADALHLILLAPALSSLREGSPLLYRGMEVGQVRQYQLGTNGDEIELRAEVHREYKPLVRVNSKFWNAGGLNFKFGLFRGAELSAESASTLLGGGIEFASPPESGPAAADGAVFRLYEKPEDEWRAWHPAIPLHPPERGPQPVQPANGALSGKG